MHEPSSVRQLSGGSLPSSPRYSQCVFALRWMKEEQKHRAVYLEYITYSIWINTRNGGKLESAKSFGVFWQQSPKSQTRREVEVEETPDGVCLVLGQKDRRLISSHARVPHNEGLGRLRASREMRYGFLLCTGCAKWFALRLYGHNKILPRSEMSSNTYSHIHIIHTGLFVRSVTSFCWRQFESCAKQNFG